MRRLAFVSLFSVCLFTLFACEKTPSGGEDTTPRTIQVELARTLAATNGAGDYAYNYLDVTRVGFASSAGDAGSVAVSQEGPSSMVASVEVKSSAASLWCFTDGMTGAGVSVPARLSKDDAIITGMAFCTNAIALSGKNTCIGSIRPLTSAVVLDILDARGKWSGADVTSVTIMADGETALAGDVTLKLQEIPAVEVRSASSTVTFDCSGLKVGTADSPASLGTVVLPCSFTGTVTVEGEGLKAVYTVSQALTLQAGYIKHITVDLSKASVEGEAPKGFPRRLGIIGDSISTFEGIIPSSHLKYYPRAGCDVDDWKKTYWGLLATQYWNCELDVNTSWSGSSVASGKAGSVRTPFVDHSRLDLFQDPDCVILFGGTNDAIASNEIGLGEYSYDTPLDQINHYRRFRDAYIYVIRYLQQKFPDVQIICIIGTDVTGEYGVSVETIARHYGLPYVDFRNDKVAGKVTIYSGSHPDAAGHAYKAKKIYDETLSLFQ